MTRPVSDAIIWELAGHSAEGIPVGAVPWDRPPRVRIEDGRVYWRYVQFAGDDDPYDEFPVGFGPIVIEQQPSQTSVKLGLLLQFLKLEQGDERAIATFARRWGVLHLCRHNIPRTHPRTDPALPGDEHRDGPYCQTVLSEDLNGSEPLSGWVYWAGRARTVLTVASVEPELSGTLSLGDEWSKLLPSAEAMEAATDNGVGRYRLGRELQTWLQIGAVEPRVNLLQEPNLRVSGLELFGMIALQLAATVTGTLGFAFCHECREAYAPKRQPRRGRRNYCDSCRARKIPERDAARASRRRASVVDPPSTLSATGALSSHRF